MTAVLDIKKKDGKYYLKVVPEVSSPREKGVTILLTEEEVIALENLDWDQE